jgi:phosphoglycolate phosphatase-like HAD superfamily hydrolase
MLEARDLSDAWTSSADVESTKPAPDLVVAAMKKIEADQAVMVGDSTFDCEAAERAGVPTIGVLTGGFSEGELREAGAVAVFESLGELMSDIDTTPLRR